MLGASGARPRDTDSRLHFSSSSSICSTTLREEQGQAAGELVAVECVPLFCSGHWRLFTAQLLPQPLQEARVLGVSVKVREVTLLVTVAVLGVRGGLCVHQQAAGEVLLHDGVVGHQGEEGAEHLAEPLDPEPGLGHQDEVVQQPAPVEAARHPHRQREAAGAHLALGVAHHEAADWAVGEQLRGEVAREVRLVPGGRLRSRVHEGEVDDATLGCRLLVLLLGLGSGLAVVVGAVLGGRLVGGLTLLALVAGGGVLVGEVVHDLPERLVLEAGPQLVLGQLVVQQQVVLHLEQENRHNTVARCAPGACVRITDLILHKTRFTAKSLMMPKYFCPGIYSGSQNYRLLLHTHTGPGTRTRMRNYE